MAELRAVWRTLKTLWKIGRCHRPRPADANSFGMSFQIHAEHLPLSNLQHSARTWNASVGELMLAAMLEWFLEKDRLHRPPARSRNHCMSVLVDLTRRAESKPMRQFGQYLSAVNIIANRRHNSSFEGLLQQVRASVRPENTVADSLHTLHGLSFNSCLVSRMPQAMSNQFQEFVFPISGAFSNVDLNAVLPTPRSDISISNYFRGTCATQMSPMILCLTTFRDTCTLTTTHRNSVYAPNEMREMARSIIGRAFGIDAATITLEQLGPSKGK